MIILETFPLDIYNSFMSYNYLFIDSGDRLRKYEFFATQNLKYTFKFCNELYWKKQ